MKYFIFILSAVAWNSSAQSVTKYFGLVYDVNKPLSNKEFIDNISKRGAKLIYREYINEKFSVGGDLGFSHYQDYVPPMVYMDGNTSIYTDLYGYVSNYSLTVSGDYSFFTNKILQPYVGLGIGATYSKLQAFYNVYGEEEGKWAALLRINAGALLRFGKLSSWGALAGFHFGTSTLRSSNFEYKNFSDLGFQVGLVYMKR